MTVRVEKTASLPPVRARVSPFVGIMEKIRKLPKQGNAPSPEDESLVVMPDKSPKGADTVNIERMARSRGMKVKAHRRGVEIWIERLA